MVDEKILRDAGLPEEKIQRLKAAWSELERIKAGPQRQIPCVVCAGIYNAGKSTLLNALTEQADYFPTGNIPTTKEIKRLEYKGAMYIDTPGLNADEGDDRETVKAYEDADYILFVSSAQDGGISQTESGWLRRMCERYTQEGFQRRLIYALSQCDQVEDDDFPAIRNQFAGDLEKSLGFAPEPIFRVDSATYADGKAQNETLLIDHSGIPQLRAYLAEKVADTQANLRKAEQAELDTRLREAVDILSDLSQDCKVQREKAERGMEQRLSEVRRAWDAFEAELSQALPANEISPTHAPYYSSRSDYDYDDFRAEAKGGFCKGEARGKVSNALRRYYDQYESIIREKAEESIVYDKFAQSCLSIGLDSVYASTCNKISAAFSKGILSLQNAGVSVTAQNTAIEAEVEIPYGLEREMTSQFTSSWKKSFSEYEGKISGYESDDMEYRSNFFGGGSYVTVKGYKADGNDAAYRLTEHINKDLERGSRRANSLFNNRVWSRFRSQVSQQVESRKAELKRQVDSYLEQLRRDAGDTSVASALSYLDTLANRIWTLWQRS